MAKILSKAEKKLVRLEKGCCKFRFYNSLFKATSIKIIIRFSKIYLNSYLKYYCNNEQYVTIAHLHNQTNQHACHVFRKVGVQTMG